MMLYMRTTVTLGAEAERLIKEAMRRHGGSFKQTLNRAVVRGLSDLEAAPGDPPFEVHAVPMTLRAGIDPTHLNRAADDLDAEAFVSLTARLQRERS